VRKGTSVPGSPRTPALCPSRQPGELGRIDVQLEALPPIHRHDGDPDPVLELQPVVPRDVDLLQDERRAGSLRLEHPACAVAETASRAGVQDDEHVADRTEADDGRRRTRAARTKDVEEETRDDLELHRGLGRGDRDSFDELYRRYAPAAYGLAYRLTGQQVLAQDVVHDSFLALWRAPEAYDPARGPFRTFFLSLVHHRAVDTIRREERMRRRNERASNLEPLTGEDVAEDVVGAAYLSVRRREVREALSTLPPDQRTVLEMAYLGGRTQAEIAEELGIPLGTVKTRTFAAMKKLRAALSQED
jgi:RNA polymerase sigma factor (sigma-70 family)